MTREKAVIAIYDGDTMIDWTEAVLHYSRYYPFGPEQQRYIRYRGQWIKVTGFNVPNRPITFYRAQVGDVYPDHKERGSR